MAKKKPRSRVEPRINKKPKEGEPPRKFEWSFQQAELDGPWGWNKITMEKLLKDVLEKLKHYQKRNWSEIEGKKSHFIPVVDLNKKAKKRLRVLELYPERLFSLRLTGTERVFGHAHENILYILWWDPEHEVCPSEPRHT